MANPSNKVQFYPLQRLDKNDVDAVQSLAHNHVDSTLGALFGVTGCLDVPTVTIDNDAELINFTDFSYMGMQAQHEGQNGAQSAFVGYYRASDSANGDCSFDAARAAVQSYRLNNGDFPPPPLNSAHVSSTHGDFFPYIYIGLNSYSSDTEQRMFWSTADAIEVAQNVATRQSQAFVFALAGPNEAIPTGSDYPMVPIARIMAWELNADGITVDLNTVVPIGIADAMFNLEPNIMEFVPFSTLTTGPNNLGGLARALWWLKSRQDSMMDNGTADPVGSRSIGPAYNAYQSLAGLEKRIQNEEERELHASAVIISMIDTVNETDTLTVRNFGNSDFEIAAYRDFAPLLVSRSVGGTVLSAPIAYSDYGSLLVLIEQAINSIAIKIPDAYAGYNMHVSLTPVYPALTGGEQYSADGQTALASTVNDYGYDKPWFIRPDKGHNMDSGVSTTAWLDSINTVSPLTAARKSDGNDRADEYGFSIMSSAGIDDLEVVNTHELYHRYVKVDITLIKP